MVRGEKTWYEHNMITVISLHSRFPTNFPAVYCFSNRISISVFLLLLLLLLFSSCCISNSNSMPAIKLINCTQMHRHETAGGRGEKGGCRQSPLIDTPSVDKESNINS